MKRREFIAGLGVAAAWPVLARAQQTGRMRRVGVLMAFDETDAEGKAQLSEFTQALAGLGWTDGLNLRMEVRWGGTNADRITAHAKELVDLQPDVILADASPPTAALQRETRRIPIVFVLVGDPISAGFVANLPRPNGNITGFMLQEPSIGGKLVQLLTELAPGIKRAALMFNPNTAPGGGYYRSSFEAAARSLKVEALPALVRSTAEIEMAISTLGREPAGGLVVVPDGGFSLLHRAEIISSAARNDLPAIFPASVFARDGGLLSYGPDRADIFRRSASYVDRILRGTNPSELPVQIPTKFEMVLNVRTAKTLGLTVPQSILLRADEVIE